MAWVQLGARDDARLAVRRHPHRLGTIELRILECGQADEKSNDHRRKGGAVDVDAVGQDEIDVARQRFDEGCRSVTT